MKESFMNAPPAEEQPSIVCEKCGGWHAAEHHDEHEQEAREKRQAEIMARPDSAYRFDTLGFQAEKKGEIEPWMHVVIEKAKELGDDLQDADFFHHSGPLEEPGYPSILSLLTQDSFQDTSPDILESVGGGIISGRGAALWVAKHEKGKDLHGSLWYTPTFQSMEDVFRLKERWVQTHREEDFDAYKKKLKWRLEAFRNGYRKEIAYFKKVERYMQLLHLWEQTKNRETFEAFKGAYLEAHGQEYSKRNVREEEVQKHINVMKYDSSFYEFVLRQIKELDEIEKKVALILENLDSYNGVQQGMDLLMRLVARFEGSHGVPNVGVIFSEGKQFSQKFSTSSKETLGNKTTATYVNDGGEEVATIIYVDSPEKSANEGVIKPNMKLKNKKSGQEFLREFIQGIITFHGSIEAQREVLQKMLELTKDHPERRLPIYNYYGKLVWPRPPKKDEKK